MKEGKKKMGRIEVGRREAEGRDLWITFLKCNHLGAALLPSVNTGQSGRLTACHTDS